MSVPLHTGEYRSRHACMCSPLHPHIKTQNRTCVHMVILVTHTFAYKAMLTGSPFHTVCAHTHTLPTACQCSAHVFTLALGFQCGLAQSPPPAPDRQLCSASLSPQALTCRLCRRPPCQRPRAYGRTEQAAPTLIASGKATQFACARSREATLHDTGMCEHVYLLVTLNHCAEAGQPPRAYSCLCRNMDTPRSTHVHGSQTRY